MSERDEELREDMRPADTADEPLDQDKDSEADQIEEAVSDARSADPRVAEPPT